jgi:ubiquinone/menaquinone biosynthesis C-methylase UbiE
MNPSVKTYYDNIAVEYDSDRFNNTYGEFIHKTELSYLQQHFQKSNEQVLNLACGTGRFMEFCSHGYDISPNMIEVAKVKHPQKSFKTGCGSIIPFEDNSFDKIICFHLIMHLSKFDTKAVLNEITRILKPGGVLIIDYPSLKRRRLFKYKAQNWHAANEYSSKEITELLKTTFSTIKTKGVLFLPIHRFPTSVRKLFFNLDKLLTRSPIKEYSSYLVHSFKKK